jgi:two-component system, OmpR family, KDP operon response regulator KdpE
VREVLEEFLAEHGYVTRSAGDAPGAFWALMQEMPDVVLLDIGLPGLSGVEIIPTIRFAGRDVKIIMVSGITDVELAKRALAYGAFDYVTKPVDLEYLLRSLETALSMKGLKPE